MFVFVSAAAHAAPYAAMVIDARTGEVLHSRNADTRLHPASLTKMMTLYIAFQAVERGEIGLDTQVTISRAAAAEPPSKLGLRAGQKIQFRYLIRAASVKSANDAATAIGEALEGSEAAFARRMNRTAKALGMTRTTFKNAHGLTENGHLSTARDMTTLGRRLFFDYPQYYNLFSRQSTHAGIKTVSNTNRRLLAAYRGADGIKTGYTRAAGFNLVASAERGEKRVIATVFGGTSSAARNRRVAELLDMGFARSDTHVAVVRPPAPAFDPALPGGAARPALAVARSLRPQGNPRRVQMAEAAPAETDAAVVLALSKADPQQIESAVAAAIGAPPPAPAEETTGEDVAAALKLALATEETAEPAAERATPDVLALVDPGATTAADAEEDEKIKAALAEALEQDATSPSASEIFFGTSPRPLPRPGGTASAEAPEQAEPESNVVTRLSTSGGRHWGINVGRFGSRHEAERVLLQTALNEIETLDEALRKVVRSPRGFDANFLGLSQGKAELACRRLTARNLDCSTIGPG